MKTNFALGFIHCKSTCTILFVASNHCRESLSIEPRSRRHVKLTRFDGKLSSIVTSIGSIDERSGGTIINQIEIFILKIINSY